MPTNVLDNIKGSELPKAWAEKIKAIPDESYTITIRPQREIMSLKQVMSELSRKAQARGLTPEKLEEILDDVREFLKRMDLIVEERGYVPHIDDGVLLNMAPLWELIPSWQAEPKKAWEALERGDYDWACQAIDHWPVRVKKKCKTNKSFAIAHGLA